MVVGALKCLPATSEGARDKKAMPLEEPGRLIRSRVQNVSEMVQGSDTGVPCFATVGECANGTAIAKDHLLALSASIMNLP